jgi:hypothetical protein
VNDRPKLAVDNVVPLKKPRAKRAPKPTPFEVQARVHLEKVLKDGATQIMFVYETPHKELEYSSVPDDSVNFQRGCALKLSDVFLKRADEDE